MRDLLIWLALGAGGLAVLTIPWWLPVYHRWVDGRMVRRINARRDAFRNVRFEADDDRREERRWN